MRLLSNLEHLIEGAIYYVEKDKTLEEFKNTWWCRDNCIGVNATNEEIWEIAQYVVYVHDKNKGLV